MKPERTTAYQERARREDPLRWHDFGTKAGWRADGSWCSEPAGVHHVTTHFVMEMVRRRRESAIPPSTVASLVEVHGTQLAFKCQSEWAALDSPRYWPLVATSSSAEETVKRAGRVQP